MKNAAKRNKKKTKHNIFFKNLFSSSHKSTYTFNNNQMSVHDIHKLYASIKITKFYIRINFMGC